MIKQTITCIYSFLFKIKCAMCLMKISQMSSQKVRYSYLCWNVDTHIMYIQIDGLYRIIEVMRSYSPLHWSERQVCFQDGHTLKANLGSSKGEKTHNKTDMHTLYKGFLLQLSTAVVCSVQHFLLFSVLHPVLGFTLCLMCN